MSAGSVLVVEDTTEIRELLVTVLERAGLHVRAVGTGREALAAVAESLPDVVVLDLGLPDVDGVELCRRLRAEHPCWVLMLTARAEEVDLLVGLAVGADGYMTKPFSPRELVARVQTFLRRPATVAEPVTAAPAVAAGSRVDAVHAAVPAPGPIVLADLALDEDTREVWVAGSEVALTRTEFDLLMALVSRPGKVLQRETLLREVWQSEWEGSLRLVEAHMSNLRRKLAGAGLVEPSIRTVRGVGYRLVG